MSSKILVKAVAALVLCSLCFYWLETTDKSTTSPSTLKLKNTSLRLNDLPNYLNRTKRHVKRRRYKKRQHFSENCKKVDFNVNFSELGWEKFIIYPKVNTFLFKSERIKIIKFNKQKKKVFNAYLCSGSCELPFKSFMTRNKVPSTNHAQIISILEFKNPQIKAETAKCVSTRLKPLTVIFIDENGRVKTKVYKDMIVDQCGCR